MKKYKSLTSMLAAGVLAFSVAGTASAADWTTYQGNNDHNGLITDGAPIATPTVTTSVKLQGNSGGAVNTAPIMQTLTGGDTFGYVLHNGGAVSGNTGGARLAKIKANGATQVWSKQLTLSAGFQLSSPLLVQGSNPASEADDAIYVGTTGFAQVLQNDELNGTSVAGWTVDGGTPDGQAVVLEGAEDVSLIQSGVTLNTSATNRAALGIWVGNTANPGIAINVTVKVDGVAKVTKVFPATTTAIEDKANLGNYYYYVNENFAATAGSNVEFEVDVVSGNTNQVKVEYASLYQQTGAIQKVTNLHEDAPSNVAVVSGITGQINTPITTDGTYLYFGTWKGGSSAGTYYQVKISDNSVKTFTPDSYGFYWAGAVKSGNYIVFGSDNGKLYYRSISNFDGAGDVIDLTSVGGVTAGNIRSSITNYNGALYFTSQEGYLWKFNIDSRGVPTFASRTKLGGTSTSTPVITENSNLYVGYYNGFTAGGVNVMDTQALPQEAKKVTSLGPVQSSIIAFSSGNKDYLYFTTNSASGAGYAFSYDVAQNTTTAPWDTTNLGGNTYTLQGMAASNGYLMFGNDFNYISIVK